MIPPVKTWLVIFGDGSRCEVLAPTRRLALLNVRFSPDWRPIKSLTVKRNENKTLA